MLYPEWMRKIAVPGEHRGKPVIWLSFPYDTQKIAAIKSYQAQYSNTRKAWYLPDVIAVRKGFGMTPKSPVGKDVLSRIASVNQPVLHRMDEQ